MRSKTLRTRLVKTARTESRAEIMVAKIERMTSKMEEMRLEMEEVIDDMTVGFLGIRMVVRLLVWWRKSLDGCEGSFGW